MIYFDKNLQKLTIPITFNKNITKIVIKNQAKSYEFSDFIVNNDKKNYFVIRFVSEISIEEGQYEYSLYSGDEVFDTGILQFGEFNRENTEYNIDKQTIIYER